MTTPEVNIHVNETKRPLVALLMADEFCCPIFNGEKKITIREGWRDYRQGEKVILCSVDPTDELGWARMAKITAVTHCKLNEVPLQDFLDDGMEGLGNAIDALSKFYDDIDEDSKVTVIRWELI